MVSRRFKNDNPCRRRLVLFYKRKLDYTNMMEIGTIYLLMLIAHAEKKSAVMECSGNTIQNLATIIRSPTPGK